MGPPKNFAHYIDHTLLRPEATAAEIEQTCREARDYGFKTVCVRPEWVELAAAKLDGSPVLPITVISFPSGENSTDDKTKETELAVSRGAREIDMVLNRSLLKRHLYREVLEDIRAVVEAAKPVLVKVILETSELTDREKVAACALAKAAGARFVKTSTGFSKGGATEADIRLMREVVGPEMGVKASGGIRSRETADLMIAAGADRLGTSASIAIVSGAPASSGKY